MLNICPIVLKTPTRQSLGLHRNVVRYYVQVPVLIFNKSYTVLNRHIKFISNLDRQKIFQKIIFLFSSRRRKGCQVFTYNCHVLVTKYPLVYRISLGSELKYIRWFLKKFYHCFYNKCSSGATNTLGRFDYFRESGEIIEYDGFSHIHTFSHILLEISLFYR